MRIIFWRVLKHHLNSLTSAIVIIGFLSIASALFLKLLHEGEGGTVPIASLWALSAAQVLPVLSALLTMRIWSDERASGQMDLFLTAPIFERDLILGSFIGAVAVNIFAILLYLTVPIFILPLCAPALAGSISFLNFIPSIFILTLQSMLWCAIGIFSSTCFRHSALAAFFSLLLMLAIPHGMFYAALTWFPALRAKLSAIPFETHIINVSTGLISTGTVIFYLVLACCALFAATKSIVLLRMNGRGASSLRLSTIFVIVLSFLFSCLVISSAIRLNVTFEIPVNAQFSSLSSRTQSILSEMQGEIRATCFLPRQSPEFRIVSRLMSTFKSAAESSVGVNFKVDYVDPRWDLAPAARLARSVPEGSILFERGRRRAVVPIKSLFADSASTNNVMPVSTASTFVGESVCASALLRLGLPIARETIYWTIGHGESSFQSYDKTYGLSDIARDLARDGYKLKNFNLATNSTVPGDCAVLVVAGAREPFSRAELSRIDRFLHNGGRMLVLASSLPNAGVGNLLANLGLKIMPFTAVSSRTQNGLDVVATDFAEHSITHPLTGSSVIFSYASMLKPSNSLTTEINSEKDKNGVGADQTIFTSLVVSDKNSWGESDVSVRPWTFDAATEPAGPLILAASLERGAAASKNLAIRPMRLVVIGDASFVMNGALKSRANANRDLFMNAIAWLSGLDASMAPCIAGDVIVTGMTRDEWFEFAVKSMTIPSGIILVIALMIFLRRRNS